MLALVGVDRLGELFSLLASRGTGGHELGEALLRLPELSRLQVQLAQVLVGPEVPGLDGERFLVEAQRRFHPAELSMGVAQHVQHIGVAGLLPIGFLENTNGGPIVGRFDEFHRALVVRRGRFAAAAVVASHRRRHHRRAHRYQ